MKKIFSYMAIAAICAGFAACDEVEEGGAGPQTNPQEPVMEQNGIAVENYAATAEAVSLAAYNNEESAGLVPVLNVTKLENFPEGYTLGGYMYLAKTEDMADAKALPLTFADNVLKVKVEDWETAHLELYTKNPKAVESYVDFELLAINGASNVRLGDDRYAHHKVLVTPLPAKVVVEEAYTMLVDGNPVEMTPTNPEDVYDPPTFSAVVEVEEGQTINVTFRSKSGILYGQGAEEGTLAENGPAIKCESAGPQKFTVNMEELTYTYALASEYLWAYTSSANQGYALSTWDYVTYRGFAGINQLSFMLANEKKLAPSVKWGMGEEEGTLLQGSTEKIPVEAKGCYYITVDLRKMTYKTTLCEFELIGGWNSWAETTKMTSDSKFVKWTADLTIDPGTEFKIRTNGSWDDPNPNLGGGEWDAETNSFVGLVEHGDNIVWNGEAGTYTVTLDLSKLPYTLSFVKK